MPPSPPPQPTRFAIQKARGKGWKTLEVGEDLAHAEARFDLMVRVNPRAYFRLVQLDHNPEADFGGMEFNWTLIHLYDPTRGGRRGPAKGRVKPKAGRRRERVPLPLRFYVAVVVLGVLAGGLAYLRWGLPGP